MSTTTFVYLILGYDTKTRESWVADLYATRESALAAVPGYGTGDGFCKFTVVRRTLLP